MNVSSFALLLVLFLDLVSQGLVVPVLTSILLDPSLDYLPTHTAAATRQGDDQLPFLISGGAATLAVILIGVLWRGADIRNLDRR